MIIISTIFYVCLIRSISFFQILDNGLKINPVFKGNDFFFLIQKQFLNISIHIYVCSYAQAYIFSVLPVSYIIHCRFICILENKETRKLLRIMWFGNGHRVMLQLLLQLLQKITFSSVGFDFFRVCYWVFQFIGLMLQKSSVSPSCKYHVFYEHDETFVFFGVRDLEGILFNLPNLLHE